MKKIFLIITLIFATSALSAQAIKPNGFAGENQAVFTKPGTGKLVTLGAGGDSESFFVWEVVSQPDGTQYVMFDKNKSQCSVLVTEEGSYVYTVTRLSHYGYQTEMVTVDVSHNFDIISIKPKSGHNCTMTGTVMTVQDFDIETYPPMDDVYDYVDVKGGSFTTFAQSTVAFLDIVAGTVPFVQKRYINDDYQWVDINQKAKVHVHDETALNIGVGEKELNSLESKIAKHFTEKHEYKKFKTIGKFVDSAHDMIGGKLKKYTDAIKGISPGIEPYANANGALYGRVCEDCYEDKLAAKFSIEGGVTFATGIKGKFPTTWSIPKIGGVYVIFDVGLSAMVKPHIDFWSGIDGAFGIDGGIDVPIDLTGGIGASAAFSDPDVLSINAMARLRLNATLSWTLQNGGSFGGFILNGELYLYVTAMSMKVAEYTIQLFRSEL